MNTLAPDVNSGFKARVRSALIILPFVLAIIWLGGWAFVIAAAAAAGIAGYEWSRMVLTGQSKIQVVTSVSAAASAAGVFAAGMVDSPLAILVFILSLCFLVFAVCYAQSRRGAGLLSFGIAYVCFSLAAIVWLRHGDSTQGLYHLATVFFCVWASDTFAYFSGRAIGGPKLAPKISPKKTWAGFVGSSLGAGLVAYGLALPLTRALLGDVYTINDWSPAAYALMGVLLGMVGQAGDLSISYFKRKFGIKDTGALIPGHGGILDRIDALMLVALVFWVLEKI
jgi:phosphatidate cytidylyltransferase